MNAGRIPGVVVGSLVVAASVVWTLVWTVVALFVVADVRELVGLVEVAWAGSAVLLGIAAFLVGVDLVRGRTPRARALGLAALSALVLIGVPLTGLHQDDPGAPASEVEPAFERAYREHKGVRRATADCVYAGGNDDGSEEWWCDVETVLPIETDTCTVDVRPHADGRVAVRVTYCLSDDT